jgi:trehalose/maltose hydrolase-like predicted phosphorylase
MAVKEPLRVESADTGDETTPTRAVMPDGQVIIIRTGDREHHISADIAYAVWQYWHATGDDTFMLEAGVEILVGLNPETKLFEQFAGYFQLEEVDVAACDAD